MASFLPPAAIRLPCWFSGSIQDSLRRRERREKLKYLWMQAWILLYQLFTSDALKVIITSKINMNRCWERVALIADYLLTKYSSICSFDLQLFTKYVSDGLPLWDLLDCYIAKMPLETVTNCNKPQFLVSIAQGTCSLQVGMSSWSSLLLYALDSSSKVYHTLQRLQACRRHAEGTGILCRRHAEGIALLREPWSTW